MFKRVWEDEGSEQSEVEVESEEGACGSVNDERHSVCVCVCGGGDVGECA